MIPVNTVDGRCIDTRIVDGRKYVVVTSQGKEELLNAADLENMARGIRKLEELTNPVNRSSFARLKRRVSDRSLSEDE